jgi:predicted dehydrogenase
MKLGIVGTGMIVRCIGPHLASWDIEVTAVAGTPRSADAVDELADAWGAKGRYTDYHDLVADPDVDTVYVAVPNFLHYAVSEAALRAGKDVICEKPLASNEREAAELAALAREEGRLLWEAVVTTRQPNFALIRDELLPRIGSVKVATVNYSQYSSRYDAFRAGEVLPAFDPAKAGGAIMDIGLYTLTYTIGLFGEPMSVSYHPNIERGIDTSGLVVLGYNGFTATNVCAKDSWGATGATIQGTDGWIKTDKRQPVRTRNLLPQRERARGHRPVAARYVGGRVPRVLSPAGRGRPRGVLPSAGSEPARESHTEHGAPRGGRDVPRR